VFEQHIEHATGSAENPLSDRGLDAKFRGLAQDVLPAACIDALLEKCRAVEALPDVAELARLAVP
jgi:hypothetical protein